jgi:hypothetical protein
MYLPFHQNSHECRTVGRNSHVPFVQRNIWNIEKELLLGLRKRRRLYEHCTKGWQYSMVKWGGLDCLHRFHRAQTLRVWKSYLQCFFFGSMKSSTTRWRTLQLYPIEVYFKRESERLSRRHWVKPNIGRRKNWRTARSIVKDGKNEIQSWSIERTRHSTFEFDLCSMNHVNGLSKETTCPPSSSQHLNLSQSYLALWRKWMIVLICRNWSTITWQENVTNGTNVPPCNISSWWTRQPREKKNLKYHRRL